MNDISRSTVLPNGVRLPYVERGDPSGLPVVFLHGVTDSWRSFEPVLPHLPRAMHAFAVTQRGHGDADRPDGGYGPRDFAEDLAALLDRLDLDAAVVVGHSMSSSIAQRFALDHPERTLGLVLVGAMRSWRDNAAIREFWRSTVSTLTDPVDPQVAREFQVSTLARPVTPAFLKTVVGESLKVPARVWKSIFEAFIEQDFSRELARITAPTLIVWGDRDAFCPGQDQRALLETIAGSQLLVHEGAGHALHWEAPERFAADLVAWIKASVMALDPLPGALRR
jgi:pimeloyl-ACP methyl ester carboxylesterase